MHRFVILAGAALLLAACTSSRGGATGTAAHPDTDATASEPIAPTVHGERIIFSRGSLDGSGPHVFSIEPNGIGETRLIVRAAETPLLSPDGTRLAFECLDGDLVRVCMANADGSDPTMLAPDMTDTDHPSDNYAPRAWSPDGERLVLIGFGGAPSGIFTMPATDRGKLVRVTTSPRQHNDDSLAVSPDGTRIAFVRVPNSDDHDGDVYVVSADGTGLVRLSPPGMAVECCAHPDWSLDGSSVVFAGESGPEAWAIYTIGADGSDRRQISPMSGWAFAPSWSPDGRTISFTESTDSGGAEIFLVHPDGSGLVQLTDQWDAFGSWNSIWSPDGSQLVFQHGDGGNESDLWVIDVDGGGLRQLTHTPEPEAPSSWTRIGGGS